MYKNIFFYSALLIFSFLNSYSQNSALKKGAKEYDKYAFIDVITTYERLANKGYKSEDMFKKLGNSYYFNSKFEGAAKWYGELFKMTDKVSGEYYYRYAQSLKSIGEIKKANKVMTVFIDKNSTDSRGDLFEKDISYLQNIKDNSGRYSIKDAGVNTVYSDYGSFVFQDKLYFTSARDTGNVIKRTHKWTGEYFTNLYVANSDSSTIPNVKKFTNVINSKFNESTPVFTKDGKTVYFTRNNYLRGKKGKNTKKTTLLKIYKATLDENNNWGNVSELPFDSDQYSTAHPALSPDEKTLFFVSDMPGTLGQSDIFKVAIKGDNNYGMVVNLGPRINTEGRESFPFVTDENEIYFASDGHPGLGGFDVFVGKMMPEGNIANIQNVGADINSPSDDFAYFINTNTRKGFFSSNKKGGHGSDDIYSFLETKEITCNQELYGVITDSNTLNSIPDANVTLYDKNSVFIKSVITDSIGGYKFSVDCGERYVVRADKETYETNENTVSIPFINGSTQLSIALEKIKCQVAIGDNLGRCFEIKNIYFDLDKADINNLAIIDLEKIRDVLQQYPKMKLDIRSHTDSRASKNYNLKLSERRAKSTISWLVKNGVDESRLTGKGLGESQLINSCSDGVKCSEEQHQANRRSEFIITAL